MIATIARVARGEGFASVMRRGAERIDEGLRLRLRFARGLVATPAQPPLLNVLATPPAARLGGIQIQLNARLHEERALRPVALLHPGVLEMNGRAWRVPSIAATGARAVVLEGTAGIPIEALLHLDPLIVAIHDLSLLDAPHARELLQRARAVIFASPFLRDLHRTHFGLPDLAAHVIEPGVPAFSRESRARGRRIAFAGSVKPHKGGALLPEIIRAFPHESWDVFGGGDESLLRPLRRLPNVTVHGYYRAGALPSLLARHDVGLALLPSIVPEGFGLTLSECWRAGVPAIAFDHGAQAERIRRDGGGWLAPVSDGAEGIIEIVRRWLDGTLTTAIPTRIATPRDAAEAHVALYRALGLVE
jgi:glycosyltransferase involved in cell wall biosynthesis